MTWRYSKNKLVPPDAVVPAFITMQIEADEGLVGFVDRTFARTVFANPIAALAQAGIATNRPEYLASAELTEQQVKALATRLGTDEDAIRARLHPDSHMPGSGVRGVAFHGQFLRLTFLERVWRRVSPKALETSPYHRAIWDIRPLAFDPATMELLLADCPVCGKRLGRRRLVGPEKCDTCQDARGLPSTDLRDHPQPLVPEEQRDILKAVAGLVDPNHEVRDRSCMAFPEPWRSLGPGEIFHILVEMSVANADATGKLGSSSSVMALQPSSLHEVGKVLSEGTDSFHEWAGATLARKDMPHWTVDRPVATTGFERLVKCPHISRAAKDVLQDMRNGSRAAIRTRRTGAFAWLNAKEIAEDFSIDQGRAQGIVTRLKSVFGKTSDPGSTGLPTTREEFANLIALAQDTVSPNYAANILKVGVEVLSGLEDIGALEEVPEPVSFLIEAGKSFREADLRTLRAKFLASVIRSTTADLHPTISTALRNSGLRPLPVSAAWHLVMDGKVCVTSETNEPNDWLRDIHVEDEKAFVDLLRKHPLTRTAEDLPEMVTTQVVAQMIDSDIVVVGQLVRNKILVPVAGTRPVLFDRTDIERFVATYVSTPELKRALGVGGSGRLDYQYGELPDSAFHFRYQRSRFYRRADCASILASAELIPG